MPLTPIHIRIYTATVSQSGTATPIATILHNTLTEDPTWTRDSAGTYHIITNGLFPQNKTITLTANSRNANLQFIHEWINSDQIMISCYGGAGLQDNWEQLSIEIRTYTLPTTEII